jgi:nucleoside-diphosphate-sugar epimerase
MRILVTGANGFIGTRLCARLVEIEKWEVTGVTRRPASWPLRIALDCQPGDWDRVDWAPRLQGQDVVIHLAGKAHAPGSAAPGVLAEYRRINVEATRRIAGQCVEAGVRRMVFVSSIKVNGEETAVDRPFVAQDRPQPVDAYGISKWEAELALAEIAALTGLEVVVIRPPLVYGPGAKGNFALLVRAVQAGLPLPLGAVRNRRSLVGLGNLVDLLATCAAHPRAAGQTFLVADGEDLSTAELIRRIAVELGRSPRLFPVPPGLLRLGARLVGRAAAADRLVGSLRVDIRPTCERLSWQPPESVAQGLRQAVTSNANAGSK